jgi:hypothetical protein
LSIPEKVQPSFTEKKTKNKNRRWENYWHNLWRSFLKNISAKK